MWKRAAVKVSVMRDRHSFHATICMSTYFLQYIARLSSMRGVKKAVKPEITGVSPDFMYIETGEEIILTVKGKDLSENASFKLTNMESGIVLPAVVVDKNLDKNQFSIEVDSIFLQPGDYLVTARNEGGFTYDFPQVTFSFSDAFDISLSLGMGYPFSTNSTIMENYWYWAHESGVTYPTFNCRLAFIPYKGKIGYIGFSLGASAMGFDYEDYTNDILNYKITSQNFNPLDSFFRLSYGLMPMDICFNFQRPLGTHFIFDLHLGGGVSLLNYNIEYRMGDADTLRAMGLCFKGGAAIQFYFRRHFYLELNADYIFNLFNGMSIQYVDPSFSLGWRF